MIIVGAKGLAKEVLEIFSQRNELDNLFFYDDISTELPAKLFDQFTILRNLEQVKEKFERTGDYRFTLGVGKPQIRYNLNKKFKTIGGVLMSAISPKADIGRFGNFIGDGVTILSHSVITNGVTIGKGCLINPHCSVSHDSVLGDFVELSPGVRITGHCRVDNFCNLGTNAVLIPNTHLSCNVIVGAGAVVTHNVEENTLVVGIPAVARKKVESFIL
jgi:sugar O-acyltransferase (sialic acid O-acetyltransferase NeuD family)